MSPPYMFFDILSAGMCKQTTNGSTYKFYIIYFRRKYAPLACGAIRKANCGGAQAGCLRHITQKYRSFYFYVLPNRLSTDDFVIMNATGRPCGQWVISGHAIRRSTRAVSSSSELRSPAFIAALQAD